MSKLVVLIADPDSASRESIRKRVLKSSNVSAIGAAAPGELYRLAESLVPSCIAVQSALGQKCGYEALSSLCSILGARLVFYGCAADQRVALDGADWLQSKDPGLVAQAMLGHGSCDGLKIINSGLEAVTSKGPAARPGASRPELIVLGASTGGIPVLEQILGDFPADCPPTLIVQHIRAGFGAGLVRRWDQMLTPQVQAAMQGAALNCGCIYIAADNEHHLGVTIQGCLTSQLIDEPAVSGHRPSVDVLFERAARIAGKITIRAALLTGMGADGAHGMGQLRAAGALTIAQSKESSTVWGMPKAAIELGGASEILGPERIARRLLG